MTESKGKSQILEREGSFDEQKIGLRPNFSIFKSYKKFFSDFENTDKGHS